MIVHGNFHDSTRGKYLLPGTAVPKNCLEILYININSS